MAKKQIGETATQENAMGGVNLEADVFGEFDAQYTEAARRAQMTAEQEQVDAQTKAQRAGQLKDMFGAVGTVSTRDAFSMANVLVEQWIPEGQVPEHAAADLQTLKELREKLRQREKALPHDDKEALEKLRTMFFGNPKVKEISERLIKSLKEAGIKAHGDVAMESQGIADAAFTKSETARELIEQYPELGEVYEVGSDTIENAKRVTHDRMVDVGWNGHKSVAVKKNNTESFILDLGVVKTDLESIRKARENKKRGENVRNVTIHSNGGYHSYQEVGLDSKPVEYLEDAYKKVEGTARTEYLVGTRSYERLMGLVENLPTRMQRHILEQQLGVGSNYETRVELVSMTSGDKVKGIENADLQIKLLREFERARVLRKISDWMSDPRSSSENYREGPRLIKEYHATVTNGDDEESKKNQEYAISNGHGVSIRFPKEPAGVWYGNDIDQERLAQIHEKDPEFFQDLASVISILKKHGHRMPGDDFLKKFPQAVDGVPYLTQADRDTQVKQQKRNLEIAASWEEPGESAKQNRDLPRVIFTAEQGTEAVKATQLEALRALAAEREKSRASEERALAAERELADLKKQLSGFETRLETELKARRTAEKTLSEEGRARQAAEQAVLSAQVAVGATERSGTQKAESLGEQIAALDKRGRETQREKEKLESTQGDIHKTLTGLEGVLEIAKEKPGLTGGNAKQAVADALETVRGMLKKLPGGKK